MTTENRAAFEELWRGCCSLTKSDDGSYLDSTARMQWQQWQTAYAQGQRDLIATMQQVPTKRPINAWYEEDAILELIHLKFESGNDVPVERITLTKAEVDEIYPELLK
ncbi:MAG TPA: hypothetical protein DD666_00575 [Advenella kashmirensis]|uniref:Uncharacterized protein n=1 Tax=Advenella kashmirensis TaxID=310575 RepID=A0A356LA78_9BURK|nr:hypothetical protein [Advenella kashmirensis]